MSISQTSYFQEVDLCIFGWSDTCGEAVSSLFLLVCLSLGRGIWCVVAARYKCEKIRDRTEVKKMRWFVVVFGRTISQK